MPIRYKFDIVEELKNRGFSTYRIRKEKLLNETTLTKLRAKDATVTLATIDTLCRLLNCQPSDLIEYVPEE